MKQAAYLHGWFGLVDTIDSQGRSWVQVMITTKGVAEHTGRRFEIGPGDLRHLVIFIQASDGRISVDYDHSFQQRGDSRAAGWFTGQAEIRDGSDGPELWAQIEWTPQAQQEIRDGHFKFISPEFSFAQRDKKGVMRRVKELGAAALTNRPFFKTMAPLTASDRSLEELMSDSDGGGYSVDDSQFEALVEAHGNDIADIVRAQAIEEEASENRNAARRVLAAADSSKPYGDVTYADPGYQADKKKRYPLDTEEHIRAAWSYINQAGNGSKYSSEDLAKVKAKIKAAMSKLGADVKATEEENDMDPKDVAAALGLAEDTDQEALLAAIKANAETPQNGGTMTPNKPDYLQMLGLDETADPDKRIAAMINKKDSEIIRLTAEVTDLKDKVAEGEKLNDRIAELEKRDRAKDVEVILHRAIDTGRVLPAEKESLAVTFADNVNGLQTLLAARPAGFFKQALKERGSSAAALDFDPDLSVLASDSKFKGDDPIDPVSGRLHLAAIRLLKEQGKEKGYTEDEYIAALGEAEALV